MPRLKTYLLHWHFQESLVCLFYGTLILTNRGSSVSAIVKTFQWMLYTTSSFLGANLPKDMVLELWNEVATLLRVPPGKLRPSDRFDKELALVEYGCDWTMMPYKSIYQPNAGSKVLELKQVFPQCKRSVITLNCFAS